MDLHNLLSDTAPTSVIQEGIDPEKHMKIVTTLCEKRKALELSMKDESKPLDGEAVNDLLQLKNDMVMFGITEIQYQAYLAKEEPRAPAVVAPTPRKEEVSHQLTETIQAPEEEGF